jgi:hypothetical protein
MTARYGLLADSPTTSLLDLIDRAAVEPTPLVLTKRAEFFLEEMMTAGADGITTIDYPGVRVGDAVHKLRKAGVNIETKYEQHGGEFAGAHGRYLLRSKVVRLDLQPGHSAMAANAEHGATP